MNNNKYKSEQYNFSFDDNGWQKKAAEEYQKRRKNYLKKNKSPLFLWGVQESPFSSFHFSADFSTLYQESHILYFTGIKQQKVALWLNPLANQKEKEILFLPLKDSKLEFWSGKMLGIFVEKEWIQFQQKLLGFRNIQKIENIEEIINQQREKYELKEIGFFAHESVKQKKSKKIINIF